MEAAEQELERRSRFLNNMIMKKKVVEEKEHHEGFNVRVRASDMGLNLHNHAYKCTRALLDSMPRGKVDNNCIVLSLKKEFVLRMVLLGTALWEPALAHMLHIPQEVFCISPLTRFMSFSSEPQLNH